MHAIGFAGIEGRDDVRMRQQGSRLDFAVEAPTPSPCMAAGGNNFRATIRFMRRCWAKDLSHAPRAELSDQVLAKEQTLALATKHVHGLGNGELAPPNQFLGQPSASRGRYQGANPP